jgi:hypothetical protein
VGDTGGHKIFQATSGKSAAPLWYQVVNVVAEAHMITVILILTQAWIFMTIVIWGGAKLATALLLEKCTTPSFYCSRTF